MKYRISREAGQDLENIWLYTFNEWSIEQADRYFNLIMDEIEFLAENPDSGKDIGELKNGYFKSRVKSHLIFYKINKLNNSVEIVRILHQQMEIENRLNENQ